MILKKTETYTLTLESICTIIYNKYLCVSNCLSIQKMNLSFYMHIYT